MPKRTDISKMLIVASGWINTIGCCCLVMAGLAVAECVTILPNCESSSAKVWVTAVRDGKPLKNVNIKLAASAPGEQGGFSVSTNDDGVAALPTLASGKQYITATAPDQAVAQLCLDVSSESKDKRSSFSIELPPSPAMQELARAERMPVRDRAQEFAGTVQDFSGAGIPGAKIEILPKGSKDETHAIQIEADASGHFFTHLASGTYVAFFRMPAFDTQIEVFEIGKGFDSKDLRIPLKIGSC
jgi:hypothetical protein